MPKNSLNVAIIQEGPVYLNLAQTMEKAGDLLSEAATRNSRLVGFGETWLSAYPSWLDFCRDVNLWDHEPVKQVFARMHANSITVPGPETDQLGKLARQHGLTMVIGLNERVESGKGNRG